MVTKDDKEKIAWVHQARQSATRGFLSKWMSMAENSRFVRLQQYSEDQLSKFSKDKRVPYTLDFINRTVNSYQGIQRDKRTEIFYYPVEPGDEVKCEVLNAVKDSCLSQNNFIYTESDIFKDGLIEKVGAVGYEWSKEKNKNGALKIFKIRPRELMWDTSTSYEYGHGDASWISRHRLVTKRDLINRYPERRKDIEKMAPFTAGVVEFMGLDVKYVDTILDKDLSAVALIDFYERKWEPRFFIVEKTDGYIEEVYYDDRKSAEVAVQVKMQKFEQVKAQIDQQNAQMQAQMQQMPQQMGQQGQGPPQQIPVPPTPELDIIKDTFPIIEHTECAWDVVFKTEVLPEPFYPIDIYHPFEHDGDWWCPVDVLKDGQRFFNKMFSMADHWISSMSKGLLLMDSRAPKGEKEAVSKAFGTTGGAIPVKDAGAYSLMESKGPAFQLFQLMDKATQNMEENSGGGNYLGKKETASESGVAVRTRVEQGAISSFIVYDNLRRWKLSVGEKVAWYLTTNMTIPQVVRIEGEELVQATMNQLSKDSEGSQWFKQSEIRPGIGFLQINTDPHNTLENLKVDCTVDEARWSVTKNQSTLQEINASMQSNPLLAKTFPPEAMVDLMNLPFSEKEKAKARMKQLEERQAALEEKKAVKPPTLSASLGDIDKLPPEGAAQLAMQFGIQLDPSSIEDPQVKDAMMKAGQLMLDTRMKKVEQDHKLELERQKAEHGMKLSETKLQHEMQVSHLKTLGDLHNQSIKTQMQNQKAPVVNINTPARKKRDLSLKRGATGLLEGITEN